MTIEIKNLNKQYNNILAVRNINFKISKGSKIGIVGSSGSGKSTFLDLIMGLIPSQHGEILIDDKNIKDVKSNWQKI